MLKNNFWHKLTKLAPYRGMIFIIIAFQASSCLFVTDSKQDKILSEKELYNRFIAPAAPNDVIEFIKTNLSSANKKILYEELKHNDPYIGLVIYYSNDIISEIKLYNHKFDKSVESIFMELFLHKNQFFSFCPSHKCKNISVSMYIDLDLVCKK